MLVNKVDPILYGAKANEITIRKFDIGAVMKAIAQDLEEFGQQGVQGVKISNQWKPFVDKQINRTEIRSPYLQVGVLANDLVLVVQYKTLKNQDANEAEVLVKDYVGLKRKLAASSVAVKNIAPKNDKAIAQVEADTRAKNGLGADDPALGGITGNIILVAHGTPTRLPNGRQLGKALGRKTPDELVAMLTTSKNPANRIPLAFDGTLTLCGCFTASGGPEGAKQDDPFALKVLELFRRKGYTKISVVGFPGEVMTASRGGGQDGLGNPMEQGDTRTRVDRTGSDRQRTPGQDSAVVRALIVKKDRLLKVYDGAEADRLAAKSRLDTLDAAFRTAVQRSGLTAEEFRAAPGSAKGVAALTAARAAFARATTAADTIKAEAVKHTQEMRKAGLDAEIADLGGRFGLRSVN